MPLVLGMTPASSCVGLSREKGHVVDVPFVVVACGSLLEVLAFSLKCFIMFKMLSIMSVPSSPGNLSSNSSITSESSWRSSCSGSSSASSSSGSFPSSSPLTDGAAAPEFVCWLPLLCLPTPRLISIKASVLVKPRRRRFGATLLMKSSGLEMSET